MANAFSLFGELKVDTTGFNRDLNKATTNLNQATQQMTHAERATSSLGKSMGMSSAAMGTATIGVTALASAMAIQAAAAVAAVRGLWNLTKSASEAGSIIKDMQDKTGLAAETLSTLKLAADNAGSSFEQVGGGISKFAKLLGQAKEGNEKAIAAMAALGVHTTDLDKGLKEVIKTIAAAKSGTDQITLAQKAFGKSGADLIPVIKQMNGDLEAAEKEAKRLGTTLSDSDAAAADEFGDTLGVLSAQVSALANKFALQFAPQITAALGDVISFLARNQGVAIEWGSAVADVVRGVIGSFNYVRSGITTILDAVGISFNNSASQASFWANAILTAISPVLLLARQLGRIFGANTPKESQEGGGYAGMGDMGIPQVKMPGGSSSSGRGSSGADLAAKAAREAEQIAARNLSANMSRATLALKRMWEELEGAVKSSFTAMLEYGGTSEEVMASMTAGMQPYIDNIKKVTAAIEYLENSKRDSMTDDEKANLLQQQLYRRKEDEKKIEELLASMQIEATKINEEYYDQLFKAQTTDLELSKARLNILKEIGAVSTLPFENQPLTPKDFGINGDPEPFPPPLTDWEDFWGMMSQRMTEFRESLPSMKEAIGENLIGGIMELGNVFSSAINSWITNGENFFQAIAKGFRQMVANIIGELVRLMVFKLLMKVFGIAASGATAGAAPAGTVAVPPPTGGFADGGMISGKGTSTSDSILARLSNGEFVMSAKAVKRWGADTLASMNTGMMPAFAGGGLVGGGMSSVTTNAPVYNIHINGGGNQDTVRSVKQGIREATRMQQREEWRRK